MTQDNSQPCPSRGPSHFDLSVIVTAHDETLVCGPTMRAADVAIAAAEAAGHSVERLVVLDLPTPETKAWFHQDSLAHWPKHDSPEGDVGRTRNLAARLAQGRYIAFLDADDLYSENWLVAGMARMQQVEAEGRRAIIHPELNWLFDAASSVFCTPGQDDPLFLPQYLYLTNYYDALCIAPREAHLAVPQVSRNVANGLSFQDWQFSVETMAAGWEHLVAPDTLIFKRRRDSSLVQDSRAHQSIMNALPVMQIDRIDGLAGHRAPPPEAPARGSQPPQPFPDPPRKGAVSHYGPAVDARVALGQARLGSQTGTVRASQHAAMVPHFDLGFYLMRHRDLFRARNLDLVAHFLRAGSREGRQPTALFSGQHYLQRYPEVRESKGGLTPFGHWITQGWAEGKVGLPFPRVESIARAMGMEPTALEALYSARYRDVRMRLEYGTLGAQVAAAARWEPLVERSWLDALNPKISPFHSPVVSERLGAMLDLQAAAKHRTARFVICVNRPRWGGSLRMEGLLAHALAALHGPENVVIVTTDGGGPLPANKLPEGARHVDLASEVEALKPPQRMRVMVEFLRSLAPEVIFNVNSRLFWEMMSIHGKALAHSSKIVACLLCNERSEHGYWAGYPLTRFYRFYDQLAAICTDSQALAEDLRHRHMLPAEQAGRVRILPAPVDEGIDLAPRRRKRVFARPQIFWAGRFDPQKRVDLVYEIARAMPDCDFRMWGEFVMGRAADLPPKPRNVRHEGVAADFKDLPLHKADLWLYTSDWDGVPQMLLEVAMTGLPLVGSHVGGTPEVLQPGFSRAIPGDAPVETWKLAIRSVLEDREGARDQAEALRARLISTRGPGSYTRAVADLLAWLETAEAPYGTSAAKGSQASEPEAPKPESSDKADAKAGADPAIAAAE